MLSAWAFWRGFCISNAFKKWKRIGRQGCEMPLLGIAKVSMEYKWKFSPVHQWYVSLHTPRRECNVVVVVVKGCYDRGVYSGGMNGLTSISLKLSALLVTI